MQNIISMEKVCKKQHRLWTQCNSTFSDVIHQRANKTCFDLKTSKNRNSHIASQFCTSATGKHLSKSRTKGQGPGRPVKWNNNRKFSKLSIRWNVPRVRKLPRSPYSYWQTYVNLRINLQKRSPIWYEAWSTGRHSSVRSQPLLQP
jgi:hypothetical protein